MLCPYCPQTLLSYRYAKRDQGRKMSLETYRTCIDKVPSSVEILFAGMAEPWLNSHCTEMLLYAWRRCHPLAVYTTCYGMTLDDVERIRLIPFIHFCIHLPDANGDMLLHPDENYCKVLQDCIRLIPQHNFVVYGALHPKVRDAIGRDVPDSSRGLISRAGNLPERKTTYKSGKLRCPACGPALNHNVLMPNGDVALCCMDYGLDHVLGNLTRQSYESLFEGEPYAHVMRGLLDETLDTKCRYCEISSPA